MWFRSREKSSSRRKRGRRRRERASEEVDFFVSVFRLCCTSHNSLFLQPPFPRLSQHLRHGFLRPGTNLMLLTSGDYCAGRNGRGRAVGTPRGERVSLFAGTEQRKTKRKVFSFLFAFYLTRRDRPPRRHLHPFLLSHLPASVSVLSIATPP